MVNGGGDRLRQVCTLLSMPGTLLSLEGLERTIVSSVHGNLGMESDKPDKVTDVFNDYAIEEQHREHHKPKIV